MKNFAGKMTTKGIVTKDYSWFEMDKTNRKINDKALKELKQDYNKNSRGDEYPFQAPIVVYWVEGMNKGIIQQGHHRYMVCVQEKKEINYIISDCYRPCSMGHETDHQAHGTDELIYSYMMQEKKSYEILHNLKETYPKYAEPTLTLFLNNKISTKPELRRGKFIIIEDPEKTHSIALERIRRFEEFLTASGRTERSKELIKTIISALERPDFDWDYFIGRCRKNGAESRLRLEYNSITSRAKANALVQFLYNHDSRKNFYF